MMLRKFIAWVRSVFGVVKTNSVQNALKVDVAVSAEMQAKIDLWWAMFQDKAPWLDETTESLNLASSIAGEMARLVTVELESGITGSARADFLQREYGFVLTQLRQKAEYAASTGGLVFKPYIDNGRVVVDFVHAGRFLPTAYNSRGEITGAVFVEQLQKGKKYYTRLEAHSLTDAGYLVKNTAYMSWSANDLGNQIPLGSVDEWANLEPELTVRRKDGMPLEHPLFSYFKMPFANQIDEMSPLGVSVYSRAINLIREADKQYSRILWEYEGSELAVDATDGALNTDAKGNFKIPERKKRLFREIGLDHGTSGDLYEVFSPEIRDGSLFNGLNQILRRIEFNCYLSYGTLSDPQTVEKTAEEIKMSKQRSYSAVCEIQMALQTALEQLVWAMDQYTSLYKLAPDGDYELSFTWGDGVLADTATEFAQRKMLADSGFLKPEKLLAWYFGISEEEAAEYLPQKAPEEGPFFEEG